MGMTGKIGAGRVLLSLTSLTTMAGAFIADWNETHVFNPNWPPHAKFHNGQTMSMGLALGAGGLYSLWGRPRYGTPQLAMATTFASMYWITQASAILYPGTALVDPPRKRGGQPIIIAATLGLNALGYLLERRRLRRA